MKRHRLAMTGTLSLALSAVLFSPASAQKLDKLGKERKTGPDAIFQRLDKNNDGKITKDEAPAKLWERLSNLDENKDGALTKEELAKRQAGRDPGQILKRLDKNNDGFLTQDEVPAKAWERLSRLDENKDSKISKEELAKFRSKRGDKPGKRGGEGKNRPDGVKP